MEMFNCLFFPLPLIEILTEMLFDDILYFV